MKDQVIRFEKIDLPEITCLHCCEHKVTQRVICGDVSQLCCDDDDCISNASNEVQISYYSYPSNFRMPHGFHIVNPQKEASSEA